MDGIDAVLMLSQKNKDTLLLHRQFAYPKELRDDLLAVLKNFQISLEKFTTLHYAVGNAFAEAALSTLKEAKQKKLLPAKAALLIGSHGQTVFHNPDRKETLQIGEGAIIAARTGITTVSDFRMADTAAGGEGAPLLPFYHQRLFAEKSKTGVAVHNLGGISNFTYLGPKGKIFSLDTGPANCLLDAAIQKLSSGKFSFDENGAFAAKGTIHRNALDFLLSQEDVHKFVLKPAPKSTGRELFSMQLLEKFLQQFRNLTLEDTLATLTAFSVETIRVAYYEFVQQKKLPLKEIIFCGGGSMNAHLVSELQKCFPMIRMSSVDSHGIKAQAMEAQAFGFYAWMAMEKKPITFASTTGCKQSAVCGKISYSL